LCTAWISILQELSLWQEQYSLSGADPAVQRTHRTETLRGIGIREFSQGAGEVTTLMGRHPSERKKMTVLGREGGAEGGDTLGGS